MGSGGLSGYALTFYPREWSSDFLCDEYGNTVNLCQIIKYEKPGCELALTEPLSIHAKIMVTTVLSLFPLGIYYQ